VEVPWTERITVTEAVGRDAGKAMQPQRACLAIEEKERREGAHPGACGRCDRSGSGTRFGADRTFKDTTTVDAAACHTDILAPIR